MKIKDTLNMGKTTFPMRAGLPKNEPIWQKKWDEDHVYEQRQKLNEGKPTFMLHDGPPFANGNIHMGHALNTQGNVDDRLSRVMPAVCDEGN